MNTFVFKVSTGYRKGATDGSDLTNWSSLKVVARSAEEAIAKAKRKWDRREFLGGVELVCEIDVP